MRLPGPRCACTHTTRQSITEGGVIGQLSKLHAHVDRYEGQACAARTMVQACSTACSSCESRERQPPRLHWRCKQEAASRGATSTDAFN